MRERPSQSPAAGATAFLVLYPDGSEVVEETADLGGLPRRGDEVAPGWIADEVEIRDGRRDDIAVDGTPVYVEVRVVPSAEFAD